VDALGWTLLHFLWQGALAALALAALQTSCRRATPQARYLLAALTLLAMLAAPMITYWTLRSHAPSAPREAAAGSRTAVPFVVEAGAPGPREEAAALRERVEPILPALVGLWGSGVLLLSLRSLGGWALARRLTRAGLAAVPAEVETQLARLVQALRVSAPVRLFESARVEVPTVVGWLRPVVLLPASTLAGLSMEQLELILAHELAHIRRRDYLVNLLQTAAETLLFYHPAVWWVSHRMRVEREHCCDDLAVAACGNALIYAHTLAELEERRSGTPALAMAASGGALLSRVAHLLGAQRPRSRAARGLSAVAAPAGLAAALGAASLLLAGTSLAPLASAPVAAAVAQEAEPATESEASAAAEEAEPADPPEPQTGEPREFPLPRILEMARAGVTPESIDELAALGYPSLTPDELIALSSQGVGPDYVRELAGQGYRELSPDQLMLLRSQGVSAEYAGELKAQGLGDLSVSALVELRSQGITPEYVAELKGAGYDGLSVSKLIGLRSQGVSGEFAAELKALGYENLSVNRLIALRSNGITPEYVKEFGSLGYRKIDVPMLIGLRSQGVTPEFVRGLKEAGYPALSAGALIQLRSAGVSAEYVRELAQAGATGLSVEELIELRSNGVSPELVKRFQGRR
jgi:beta-lactamase regulating signal transducer with metallopeptidase domain